MLKVLAVVAIVVVVFSVSKTAFAQSTTSNLSYDLEILNVTKLPHYVVFLGYTDEQVAQERALYARTFTDLPSQFAPYLKGQDVQFVAAPHANDLLTAKSVMLPALRVTNPIATFVFVSKDALGYSMLVQSQAGATAWEASKPFGATDVSGGYAVVMANDYMINTIEHEQTHLIECGTFHDADGKTFSDGHIERYPGADALAWCSA